MKKLFYLLMIVILISACEEKKITNENKEKHQLEEQLIGTWTSTGHQYTIYDYNTYDPEKEIPPYILELTENKKAEFQMDDVTMNGEFEISDDNKIYIKLDYTVHCELIEKQLNCEPPIGTMKKQD